MRNIVYHRPFLADIKQVQARAREHMRQGGGEVHRHSIVKVLNDGLAAEILCVARYKRQHDSAADIGAGNLESAFTRHASEEQGHADRISDRIERLGGEAVITPCRLTQRKYDERRGAGVLDDMVIEDIAAERVCIEIYREILGFIGDKDRGTSAVLEDILSNEEEHSDDLESLLQTER